MVEAEDGGLRLMGLKDGEIITTVFSTSNTNNFSLKYSAYSRSRFVETKTKFANVSLTIQIIVNS